jgi:hypothetical protein
MSDGAALGHLANNSKLNKFQLSAHSIAATSIVNENLMEGDHLVLTCSLSIGENKIRTHALVDCGATGYAFIDENFASHHKLSLDLLNQPRALEVIDGRPIASGNITHITKLRLEINQHHENLPLFVTRLGHYPIVLGIPWLKRHDPSIRFASNQITFDSEFCLNNCQDFPTIIHGISTPVPENPELLPEIPDIPPLQLKAAIISSTAFRSIARNRHKRYGQDRLSVFALSLHDVNMALERKIIQDEDLEKVVPSEYHEFLPLFSEVVAKALPPHRPYDHRIPLREGFTPPFGPLYSLSHTELKELKRWLEENLSKGFIRASSSPAGAPILFVKKADGSLRLCVDYRGLNEGTIKNRYPLPLIRETLNNLSKAKWFTKLDVRGAYNLLRVAEGEEWKTAFRTRYGLYESLVMPFGLTNAPADFQKFINDILHPYLDRFCSAYLDDILIYSDTLEEHIDHVSKVLQLLSKNGLHLKPEKCEFHKNQVQYLGLIITSEGIKMDPRKISTVQEWETPKHVKDVQSFLGFANFYRRFILGYSKIVAPLTNLTRKGIKFDWTPECQEAFERLKSDFTSAPILRHFDPDREILVETDASDYVSAGILSQRDDNGILHPVAFFSKKHSPAECNYEIYDKELMAIVRCFEEWRPELESTASPIQVLSDHRNLEYFMSTKLLNRRQARWSEFLSRFNFKIVYRPGKSGGKPDALTRRSGDLPKEGDERLTHQSQTILKRENLTDVISFQEPLCINETTIPNYTIEDLFLRAYREDPFPESVLEMIRNNVRHSRKISLAECSEKEGRLIYRERIYVPESTDLRLRLLQQYHDSPTAGHPGRSKTLELITREYYWPKIRQDVERYVKNCHTCQRSRTSRHAPFGILRPLPIPHQPWQDISMDFVTGLPESAGYDAIWVVADRLTKVRHLVPCKINTDAQELADMFITHIWKYHGLPNTIISDRGSVFASAFWTRICLRLGIERKLSTPFHPETDGQTEKINGVMEQYLRCYVNYLQNDWSHWLPLAEFAANNHVSETTGVSPFFAMYGRDPRTNFQQQLCDNPEKIDQITADSIANTMQDIYEHVKLEMGRAQERQQEQADRHRLPAPKYIVGDKVWLNARNIRTLRPSQKLDHRRLGPFPITAVISPYAYRIELPPGIRIHPVQSVSLLEPADENPYPGQRQPPPPPVIVQGEEEWVVEKILDSRIKYRRLEYLIKWEGFDQPDWTPARDVNGLAAIDIFHNDNPHKPGPLPEDV